MITRSAIASFLRILLLKVRGSEILCLVSEVRGRLCSDSTIAAHLEKLMFDVLKTTHASQIVSRLGILKLCILDVMVICVTCLVVDTSHRMADSSGVVGLNTSTPSTRPLVFAYYVTGHGFGHATRVVEVRFKFSPRNTCELISQFLNFDRGDRVNSQLNLKHVLWNLNLAGCTSSLRSWSRGAHCDGCPGICFQEGHPVRKTLHSEGGSHNSKLHLYAFMNLTFMRTFNALKINSKES